MVNNRSTLELLKIVLDNVNTVESSWIGGLCMLSENLFVTDVITEEEYRTILKYLDENLPTKQKNGYCWRMGSKLPRKKWLENQIKLLEETK